MEAEKQKINPQHALLIEDNEACQRIMTHFLQQLNYEIDLANEGEKAVKMAQDKEQGTLWKRGYPPYTQQE
jgi:DNA-binding response OmpR family regulator